MSEFLLQGIEGQIEHHKSKAIKINTWVTAHDSSVVHVLPGFNEPF